PLSRGAQLLHGRRLLGAMRSLKKLLIAGVVAAAWVAPASADAASGSWSAPALVPGESGLSVVPWLGFAPGGAGLVVTEPAGMPRSVGSAVHADAPAPAHPLNTAVRMVDFALYGQGSVVGVGYERRRLVAGFGTVDGPL